MEIFKGLTQKEVLDRLEKDGFNEIPSQKKRNTLGIIKSVVREPMILILLASGMVYLLLGEPRDSVVLFTSILVVVGITLYQERKTEHALQALKDLSSPRALVLRDGIPERIPGREVVVGDIILLQEGDRIPADAAVVESQNLLIDESLLTGESLPVDKHSWDGLSQITTGLENRSFVFSGTLVSQGSGKARVLKVGMSTEMGKIGKSLDAVMESDLLLKMEIGRIVRIFGGIGILSCVVIFLFYFLLREDALGGLLHGLTLSMAILPEEFPVVLTIFLALGAWRLSKKNVLTRNSNAIETLGATTVLCVDKTGTLTENTTTLTTLVTKSDSVILSDSSLNEVQKELLYYSKLSSKRTAFDPLEKEINEKFLKLVSNDKNFVKDWHLKKAYEISKENLSKTRVWKSPDSKDLILATKGAPEAVLSLCKVKSTEKKKWLKQVEELSRKGERVLGVAKGVFKGTDFPDSQNDFKLSFLGLVGFVDPMRLSVPPSMKICQEAGIRVIMITGDYPGTAKYIASQAGIKNPEKYILGEELSKMEKENLRERIKETNIFARIVPEQKLKIVEALKENGEVVAMTGDGVNDGPALKAAHIGVAMGGKGTDVARESADLVLLDDDFSSIVEGIGMGRRIYDNIQKAVSYLYSIHIPIVGVTFITTFFDLPLLLLPIHIAFLEFIIDPASTVVFEMEPSDGDIMKRAPRRLSQKLFGRRDLAVGFVRGITILVFVIGSFILSLRAGESEGTSRTMSFITLTLCNLFLIGSDLTRKFIVEGFKILKNKAFLIITATTVFALFIVLRVKFLTDLFHFSIMSFDNALIVIVLSFVCLATFEFTKIFLPSKTER